jgi:hypothetical protein
MSEEIFVGLEPECPSLGFKNLSKQYCMTFLVQQIFPLSQQKSWSGSRSGSEFSNSLDPDPYQDSAKCLDKSGSEKLIISTQYKVHVCQTGVL